MHNLIFFLQIQHKLFQRSNIKTLSKKAGVGTQSPAHPTSASTPEVPQQNSRPTWPLVFLLALLISDSWSVSPYQSSPLSPAFTTTPQRWVS